ncbi:hypothetical protein R1sor_014601 [Riccia sorocarpa]|uniref:Eukaryotic translation initiation factor 3 subunit D n=1 Tax=Riccia sorocarpa TaxID=122646 RepID=A0ABD3H9W6_9MARC
MPGEDPAIKDVRVANVRRRQSPFIGGAFCLSEQDFRSSDKNGAAGQLSSRAFEQNSTAASPLGRLCWCDRKRRVVSFSFPVAGNDFGAFPIELQILVCVVLLFGLELVKAPREPTTTDFKKKARDLLAKYSITLQLYAPGQYRIVCLEIMFLMILRLRSKFFRLKGLSVSNVCGSHDYLTVAVKRQTESTEEVLEEKVEQEEKEEKDEHPPEPPSKKARVAYEEQMHKQGDQDTEYPGVLPKLIDLLAKGTPESLQLQAARAIVTPSDDPVIRRLTLENENVDVKTEGKKYEFKEQNPFASENEEVASVAYRYRKWKLDEETTLVARCELHSVAEVKGQEVLLTVNSLNEFDSKITGVDWRQKIENQRGAVLATELKNNANKLAKWTAQALLAGAEQMKLGYVSRVHPKDHYNHCILTVQGYKPKEFAAQINLSVNNMWGILKTVVDICMKLEEGKYLLVKDPNKPIVSLVLCLEGVVERLVSLLTRSIPISVQEQAAFAFASLACVDGNMSMLVLFPGALEKLVTLLGRGVHSSLQYEAARAFFNLAVPKENEVLMAGFPNEVGGIVSTGCGRISAKCSSQSFGESFIQIGESFIQLWR